jgi:hypothetical protein
MLNNSYHDAPKVHRTYGNLQYKQEIPNKDLNVFKDTLPTEIQQLLTIGAEAIWMVSSGL